MEIRERLRQLIKDKGVTPYEIYIKTGVNQSTISLILTGKTKRLNIRNSELLASYFGVTREWLTTGLGDQHPTTPSSNIKQDLPIATTSRGSDEWEIKIRMLQERIDELKAENLRLTKENAVLDYLISTKKLE